MPERSAKPGIVFDRGRSNHSNQGTIGWGLSLHLPYCVHPGSPELRCAVMWNGLHTAPESFHGLSVKDELLSDLRQTAELIQSWRNDCSTLK